ncbi:uncharacterized protein [Nicotiana sylvestris]|uniref:uncharacterized protein n=1 Tax=Nicotiana sylvestris TaxID=4096 RepID=UPI00388C82EA
MTGSGRTKELGVLEEKVDVTSNCAAGFDVASASRNVGPDGSGFGTFQGHGLLLGDIGDPNDFIQNFPVSSEELRDAKGMIGAMVGTPFRGEGFIANIFDGVTDEDWLDVSGAVKEAEKSLLQSKEAYDHAILWLHEELSGQKKERNNIASKLQDSEARGARRDKELEELQASLEAALREKAALSDKVEQSNSRISQLEAEVSGLKERRETVIGELATSRGLLSDTRREIATLATAKSKAERDYVTYREDVATSHAMVRDISLAAGQKLARAVDHAKAKVKREVLEELESRGFEISADLEEARVMEGRMALLIVPGGGEDDNATHWSPGGVPDLAEWSRRLAACWAHDRRRWRDLSKGRREAKHHGVGSSFKARLDSSDKEKRLLAQGSRSAGKRKDISWCEKVCGEAPPPQRLRGSNLVGRQASEIDALSDVVSALDETHRLGLVLPFFRLLIGSKLCYFVARPHCGRLEKGKNPSNFFMWRRKMKSHLYGVGQIEAALGRPSWRNRYVASRAGLYSPFCPAIFDVPPFLLEDKAEELEQLWGEVGKAKREFTELQTRVRAHSKAKERAQAATSALEAQIKAAHANDSALEKMIARLSSELSRAKTEVVNVQAEVVMNNTRAGQKMAAHSWSAATAKVELMKTLDRANNRREYERCRSRRETLEEIYARGFDLSEEIRQAKREEFDAKFLISDDEDDEEKTVWP